MVSMSFSRKGTPMPMNLTWKGGLEPMRMARRVPRYQ
jgi:hypothetical protein